MILRDKRIDSLKGLLIVMMVLNHFGGPLKKITHQTFGYVSVAEGFIFLSGYVFALVYIRYIKTPKVLISHSINRAWIVYKYHFIIIITLFLLYLTIEVYHEAWQKLLFPNNESPYLSTFYEALLLHQPTYMDILPMYIIFLLFAPFILIQLHKGNFKLIFFITISLWLVGQSFHFIGEIVKLLQLDAHPGYFNIFSWQLMWTIGMYMGYMKSSNIEIKLLKNRIFFYTVLILAIIFFLYRYHVLEFGRDFILSLLGKSNLEVLRLLNFLLISYLFWSIMRYIPTDRGIPWLQFIGRFSLQVFSFHVLLIYLLLPLWLSIDKSNHILTLTFLLLAVTSLTIPAYIADRIKKSEDARRKPVALK